MEIASGALVVVMAGAHARVAVRGRRDDRQVVLERCIGQHLRIVGGAGRGQLKGLVRRVDRGGVALRLAGSEVRLPFDQIEEIWQGRRLLARW